MAGYKNQSNIINHSVTIAVTVTVTVTVIFQHFLSSAMASKTQTRLAKKEK